MQARTDSGFLPILRRGSCPSVSVGIDGLYIPYTVELFVAGCSHVVHLSVDRNVSLYACLLCVGGESLRKGKAVFLAAWGVTLFVPYYREFVNPYLWGSCSWNEFYMLYNFAGFNGYLLLGHYLRHHDFSLARTLGWGIPSFVIGFLITFLGFRHITSLPEYTEEQLEMFFYYCSPNVVMMTVPCFLIAKKVNVRNERLRQALANLTVCGFGVYMIHYFFTGPCVLLARMCHIPVAVQIPVAA